MCVQGQDSTLDTSDLELGREEETTSRRTFHVEQWAGHEAQGARRSERGALGKEFLGPSTGYFGNEKVNREVDPPLGLRILRPRYTGCYELGFRIFHEMNFGFRTLHFATFRQSQTQTHIFFINFLWENGTWHAISHHLAPGS